MRVFLDTNVLASALATRGLCADLFRVVVAEHELILGEVTLDELRRVLATKFRLPSERITEVEEFLRAYEIVPRPSAPDPVVIRDEADRWIVASAVAGSVDVMVTGDNDLLSISSSLPLRLLSPRAFWEELRGGLSSR